jgi:hypothetical protein
MKDRIELDHVVLIGRTFEEYCRYFQLQDSFLESNRILDVGSGVSSFCAESGLRGYDVTAADPIYDLPVETIAAKSAKDLKNILQQVPAAAHKYNWTFYRDVNELARYRTAARYRFLEDYSARRDRYVPSALPNTAFDGNEFDIALASHLLFLYDDLLDYEFHKRSILELSRIVRHEIRIYPLANMSGVKSPFLEQLLSDPDCSGLSFTILKSDFEFFKNANEMLKIQKT